MLGTHVTTHQQIQLLKLDHVFISLEQDSIRNTLLARDIHSLHQHNMSAGLGAHAHVWSMKHMGRDDA